MNCEGQNTCLVLLVNGATHIVHHREAGYGLQEVIIRSAGSRKMECKVKNIYRLDFTLIEVF